jgi:hypothetical protein
MRSVRKVQVAVDEIIDMVPVRNGVVTTVGPVTMGGVMAAAGVTRRAGCGIGRRNAYDMLVDMVFVQVVKMTVVEVVLMVFMVDGAVTAIGSVPVHVSVMHVMDGGHACLLG